MSIASSIQKLNNIKAEIKRRSVDLRNLRKEKKRIEAKILEFLEKSGHSAVKYRDQIAIIKETRKKCNRKYQNPTLRHSAATSVLKNLGIELGFKQIMTVEPEKNMKKINNSSLEIAREDHAEIIKMMN